MYNSVGVGGLVSMSSVCFVFCYLGVIHDTGHEISSDYHHVFHYTDSMRLPVHYCIPVYVYV